MSIDTTKIIHAPVGGGRYTVTAPIVKEDYGLYLQIEGVELPQTYEVDFSNSEHNGTSVTMIGNSDGVLIPNQFIASGKDVFAFLYHVGDNYGRTVFKFRIPNKLRPDRTDDQPTPEEQSTIDQAISALNSAVEQTAQDVIDAGASAQSASADAERAEEARTDAQNYATQAEQSATDASQSASQASASATASAQSAEQSAINSADAQDSAEEAQGYASASAQSATASANSASQASASATSASQSATSAQGYASQAQTSAQTASSKASEASGYASTASTKADEASNSASTALGYKTDAENAKIAAQTAQGKAEDAQTAAETAQGKAEDAQEAAELAAQSISSSAAQIATNTADIADLQTDVAQNEADILKAFPTDSASGSIASFPDGVDDIPLKSLVVDINPVQDLHGYDSPWVAGGGKNLLDVSSDTKRTYNSSYSNFVFDEQNKSVTINGNTLMGFSVPVEPNTTYTYYVRKSGGTAGVYIRVREYSSSDAGFSADDYIGQPISILIDPDANGCYKKTFTTTADTHSVLCALYRSGATDPAVVISDFMLSKDDSLTEYSPYENICPISGWTGCNLNHVKANLFDNDTTKIHAVTHGTANEGEYAAHWGYEIYLPAGTYTIKAERDPSFTASRYIYGGVYKKSGNHDLVTTANIWVNKTGYTRTITLAEDEYILYFNAISTASFDDTKTIFSYFDITMWVGTEVGDYAPYQGTLIPISWQTEAGTVYGGRLDVLSGVLTINNGSFKVSDYTWTRYSTEGAYKFYCTPTGIKGGANTRHNGSICSEYVGVPFNSLASTPYAFSDIANGSGRISVHDPNFYNSTAQEFMTAKADVRFVYLLATPITVQLSPTEVKSLLGQNNIFADTGDVSVEYRADTKLYISRLTEPDADMIADSNIVSGQYFMVGNNLYKATANIASGSAVIVGTNATRKSLAQALNEINA